jgi:hypothetical protein
MFFNPPPTTTLWIFTMSSLATFDAELNTAGKTLVAPPPPRTPPRGFVSRLLGYGKTSWRKRALQQTFAAAQLALGERMFAAGIDDGELGAQIAVVDDRIRRAEAAKASTKALRAERQRLLMRLAAAALQEDAPLPGADDEYDNARRAEAALRDCEAGLPGYAAPRG